MRSLCDTLLLLQAWLDRIDLELRQLHALHDKTEAADDEMEVDEFDPVALEVGRPKKISFILVLMRSNNGIVACDCLLFGVLVVFLSFRRQ